MFHRTFACMRKASITIPRLSPTHTRAKIVRWCIEGDLNGREVESYDPLFVVVCSPDVVSEGYREHVDHEPLMIVEAHDEGVLKMKENISLDVWYHIGHVLGEIDDGADDGDESEWLWQAYSHEEKY